MSPSNSDVARPRKRLSLQICRVVCIMQTLYQLKEASLHDVHSIVSKALPKPVCKRTIRRDLEALEVMGFVTTYPGEKQARKICPPIIYALKEPALINNRVEEALRKRKNVGRCGDE